MTKTELAGDEVLILSLLASTFVQDASYAMQLLVLTC